MLARGWFCLRSLGTRDLPGYAEYTEQVRFRLFPLSGDKRRETLGFAPHMFLIRRLAISNISPGSWSGEKPKTRPDAVQLRLGTLAVSNDYTQDKRRDDVVAGDRECVLLKL